MAELQHLLANPWSNVKWDSSNRPAIIVDGKLYALDDLKAGKVTGNNAYIVGANEKNIALICSQLDPVLIHFYDMKAADLSIISKFSRLRHLAIRWNTKITHLKPLAQLEGLESLVLEDTAKVLSISPLSELSKLRYLNYSGGIWNKNTAESLEPLSNLKNLEQLILTNIKLVDGSLKPLVQCQSIKKLVLSNQFKTEEYAYLTANMPNTVCDMFKASIKLEKAIGKNDVMVVGSRKPFLNSISDKVKLEKYHYNFNKMVSEFSLNQTIN